MSKRFGARAILDRAAVVAEQLGGVRLTLDNELPYDVQTPVDKAMDALGAIVDAIELIEQRKRVQQAQLDIEKQRKVIMTAEERIKALEGS